MGLAGAKRRTKLSSDPNNIAWSSRTDTFGHRILASQGWTPGSYLGATDASQKEHYTAASASHIKVSLKDDNLGLGASRKREGAETFGLDQFSGLLGRLNGKSEAVLGKEEEARRDVRLRLWANGRGGMRFVSAGFLVGDKVEALKRAEVEKAMKKQEQPREEKVQQGKKRKADGRVKNAVEEDVVRRAGSEAATSQAAASTSTKPNEKQADREAEKTLKRQRKEEKRQRKAEREQRREEKRARRAAKEAKRAGKSLHSTSVGTAETSITGNTRTASSSESETEVGVTTPNENDSHATVVSIPRRMIRQRYIQQKRLAGSDLKSLNEIFMIKAPS